MACRTRNGGPLRVCGAHHPAAWRVPAATTAAQRRCVSTSGWLLAPGGDNDDTAASREARRAARRAKRGGSAGGGGATTEATASTVHAAASAAPAGDGGNKEEKPKKLGAIAKVKQLWDQYGYVALGLYASLWVVPVGGFYVALAATDNFGVDPVVLLEWANIEWRPTSLKPWHTTATMAVIASDVLEPVRLMATVALAPPVSRWWKKRSAAKAAAADAAEEEGKGAENKGRK